MLRWLQRLVLVALRVVGGVQKQVLLTLVAVVHAKVEALLCDSTLVHLSSLNHFLLMGLVRK